MTPIIFDNNTLREGVNAWIENSITAEGTYGLISDWDVSLGTDFSLMFRHNPDFNIDISNWDVSSGINFDSMFYDATSYKKLFVSVTVLSLS